jgi:calcium/calmodulin-dependent protein kinase kinase 2
MKIIEKSKLYKATAAMASGAEARRNAHLLNELEVLGKTKIHHPNIVQLREVIEDNNDRSLYLVMQYLKGQSLQAILDKEMGPIETKVAWKWARMLISALYMCHEETHVCHNDIKPENLVVLNKSNRLVLVDFGVSFAFKNDEDTLKSNARGTTLFFAPEVVKKSIGKRILHGR